jgi:fumarate hydratase class II
MRKERDILGEVDVEDSKYWGSQTQRALKYFSIADEIIPRPVIKAIALLKKAAAQANLEIGILDQSKSFAIIQAADEIIRDELREHFPLHIWQTGSGTQSNMNINEVIANRANQLMGYPLGLKHPIHPNDHVNMSQSSNDIFPSAMHIASLLELNNQLLPAIKKLKKAFAKKIKEFKGIIKVGRTHLMDAVPIELSQEFLGYLGQIEQAYSAIIIAIKPLQYLALGGSAVGTGVNCNPQFAKLAIKNISSMTGIDFKAAINKFTAMASHDPFVFASGSLKMLATSLMKISNDIALMGSGPRCGLMELYLPENEPGSSIMPGKINPTQCEAMMMVCAQVIGADVTISIGASRGNFEINVFKPLIIYNFLQSIRLLSTSINNYCDFLIKDLKPNKKRINELLNRSLMVATTLSTYIGYDKTAHLVRVAFKENISLQEANKKLNLLPDDLFEKYIDYKKMV